MGKVSCRMSAASRYKATITCVGAGVARRNQVPPWLAALKGVLGVASHCIGTGPGDGSAAESGLLGGKPPP